MTDSPTPQLVVHTHMATISGNVPTEVRIPRAYVGDNQEVSLRIGSELLICKDREAYEAVRRGFAELVMAGERLWPLKDSFTEVEEAALRNLARYGTETARHPRRTRPSGTELAL